MRYTQNYSHPGVLISTSEELAAAIVASRQLLASEQLAYTAKRKRTIQSR
jgi:hypothetical protein